MSRICPLFSGSNGNCTYIGTASGGILIDAGASYKGICETLKVAEGDISEIRAIAVTHEHEDHIKGLKTVLNKTGAMLIASEQTLDILIARDKIPGKTKVLALGGSKAEITGIEITRFATSHDCDGSSGYSFILPDGKKVSLCTDTGIITDEIRKAVSGSEVLLIESNHDIEMLKKGPYPPELKMRILSQKGHLSNTACASEFAGFLKCGTKRFILCHLSQRNNTPLLAKSAATAALMDEGARLDSDYNLIVAGVKGNRVTVI